MRHTSRLLEEQLAILLINSKSCVWVQCSPVQPPTAAPEYTSPTTLHQLAWRTDSGRYLWDVDLQLGTDVVRRLRHGESC